MSPDCKFWQYNGYLQPIDCDVRDYIINDINLLQMSKVFAVHNSANFEIEWYYCSASSTEINRCVVWNYRGNEQGVPYWNIGRPPRTCGVDLGAFRYPIRVDASGNIWDHEVGFYYDTPPFATTGPVEIGQGDRVFSTEYLIPDDATVGDVTVSFIGRLERDGDDIDFGTYTLTERTPIRFTARQFTATYTGASLDNWRVGSPSVDGVLGSER